ncbi:MAG: RNA polymerase factor sigma-54 [Chlamydiales bacterium]
MHNLMLKQIPQLNIKQNQQLLLSVAMQQAFHVLQMPILELEEWLKNEIEQNPAIEYLEENEEEEEAAFSSEEKEIDFEKSGFEVLKSLDEGFEDAVFGNEKLEEPGIAQEHSLFEHLMQQAKLSLSHEELPLAEQLIGNLDEQGFLRLPLASFFDEDKRDAAQRVLEKVQEFDPPGIAAFNLQHSLLLQLHLKGKGESLAFQIIREHFDDLIHQRALQLQKKLNCSRDAIDRAIYQEIGSLNLYPAARFNVEPTQPVLPDLILEKEEEGWRIEVNEAALPHFRIDPIFHSTGNSPQEQTFFRKHVAAAKWLERILERRRKMLRDTGNFLVKNQEAFLTGASKAPSPLTMQELAQTLGVHPTTIVRAVAHKFVLSPIGMLPLRSFFSQTSFTAGDTEISSGQAKEVLRELIAKEDKKTPLSDQALSRKMQHMGVSMARRTVAKYRRALKIATASARRDLLEKQ